MTKRLIGRITKTWFLFLPQTLILCASLALFIGATYHATEKPDPPPRPWHPATAAERHDYEVRQLSDELDRIQRERVAAESALQTP